MPSNNILTRSSQELSGACGPTTKMKHLLNPNNALDSSISNIFPLPSTSTLNISSSTDLLNAYEEISKHVGYYDVKRKLKDVTLEGFTKDHSVILSIIPEDDQDPIKVYGTPVSSKQFFDIFEMTSYARSLIKLYYKDKTSQKDNILQLLELNTKIMLLRFAKRSTQFRLLFEDGGDYILRGVMGSGYNNYDNNIVIYVLLQTLHKINTTAPNPFLISSYCITESTLRIYISRTSPTHIPNIGELYFDVIITNDETGAGKVMVETRYRFYNIETGHSFSCIPPSSKSLIALHHRTKVTGGIKQFKRLERLAVQNNIMAQHIQYISEIPKLTPDIAYSLLKKIRAKGKTGISSSLKNAYQELHDTTLVNTTYNLIEGLNKVTNLSKNIDERIALEYIYYRLILEVIEKKNKLSKEKKQKK